MKASDLIASKISKLTNHVFTGQGGSVVHILDSLSKIKKIQIVPSQNEQGASLAADAYTRCSGKLGIVIATSGPGILNTLQGIACSYFDSIPGVYISGAPVIASLKKSEKNRQVGFQEMDIVNLVKATTKYAVTIINPNRISYEIDKCIHLAQSGRPGPTLIDIPDDIQRINIDPRKQIKFIPKKNRIVSKNINFKKLSFLLQKSKRPLVVIGNGVKISKTEKLLNTILNKFNIPYAATWACADSFPASERLNVGSFGTYATRHGNLAIQNSDLLLILGSKLNRPVIGSNPKLFAKSAKKIQVDIDTYELKEENGVNTHLKINEDLKLFIPKLKKYLKKLDIDKDWYTKINNWKKKYPIIKKDYLKEKNFTNPYIFFRKLSDICKKNYIIVNDASANLVWSYQSFISKKGQKIFTALNHSPMGYSIAASIGASLGAPKKKIIVIIGDGSVPMNVQELENIKSLNLPVYIFIINNRGYGMIKQTLNTWLKGNYVGCDKKSGLSLPDYNKIFSSYGIRTSEINSNNEVGSKLKTILNQKGPIMCQVKVNPNAKIIPKTKPGDPIDVMSS